MSSSTVRATSSGNGGADYALATTPLAGKGAKKKPSSSAKPAPKRVSIANNELERQESPRQHPLVPSLYMPPSHRKRSSVHETVMSLQSLHTASNATKVYVRVRPFNEREKQYLQLPCLSTMRVEERNPAHVTILDPARDFAPVATYAFERVLWSISDGVKVGPFTPPKVALQDTIYQHVGRPVLENLLQGYNGCVFAYGQTGSGKTYTMMGNALKISGAGMLESSSDVNAAGADVSPTPSPRLKVAKGAKVALNKSMSIVESPENSGVLPNAVSRTGEEEEDCEGIIPRICRELFAELHKKREKDNSHSFRVEMEYYEIYNEKVMDLLNPHNNSELRVRQISTSGPFVEGLTRELVGEEHEIFRWLQKGSLVRHTAATKMNDRSSRSHAILSLHIVQMMLDESDASCRVTSKLNLVDLAGSERTGASGVEGKHFKEATKINLSLTTLGRVIDCLADKSTGKGAAAMHCPYRDSNLTWLLMDSLGGNSKTTMIATVSPHALNYEEMCQTIRYASRAKQIVNKAVVNEDPQIRQIKLLAAEVERLRSILAEQQHSDYSNEYVEELRSTVRQLEHSVEDYEERIATNEKEIFMLKQQVEGHMSSSKRHGASQEGGRATQPEATATLTSHTHERLQKLTSLPRGKESRSAPWTASELAELVKNLTVKLDEATVSCEAHAKRAFIMIDNHGRTLREHSKQKEQKERAVLEAVGNQFLAEVRATVARETHQFELEQAANVRIQLESAHSKALKDLEKQWKKRVDTAIQQGRDEERRALEIDLAGKDATHKKELDLHLATRAALETQVEQLKALRAQHDAESEEIIRDLQRKVRIMEESLAHHEAEHAKKVKEMSGELETMLNERTSLLANMEARTTELERGKADLQSQLAAAQSELKKLRAINAAAKAQREIAYKKRLDESTSAANAIQQLSDELRTTQTQLCELQDEHVRLQSESQQQRDILDNAKSTLESLQVRLTMQEEQHSATSAQLAEAVQARDEERDFSEREKTRLGDHITSVEHELHILRMKAVEDAKKHEHEVERKDLDLQHQKEEHAAALRNLEATHEAALGCMRDTHAKELESLRSQLGGQLAAEAAQYQEALEKKDREMRERARAAETAMHELEEKHNADCEALARGHRAVVEEMEAEAKKRMEVAASVQSALETLAADEKQRFDDELEKHRYVLKELRDKHEGELAELRLQTDALRAARDDLERRLGQQQDTTQSELLALQKQLDESREETAQLRAAHEQEVAAMQAATERAIQALKQDHHQQVRAVEDERHEREKQLLSMLESERRAAAAEREERKVEWRELLVQDAKRYREAMESAESKSRQCLEELHALVGQVRSKHVEETVRKEREHAAKFLSQRTALSEQLQALRKLHGADERAWADERAAAERELDKLKGEMSRQAEAHASKKNALEQTVAQMRQTMLDQAAKAEHALTAAHSERLAAVKAVEDRLAEATQDHQRTILSLLEQHKVAEAQGKADCEELRRIISEERRGNVAHSIQQDYKRVQREQWALTQSELLNELLQLSLHRGARDASALEKLEKKNSLLSSDLEMTKMLLSSYENVGSLEGDLGSMPAVPINKADEGRGASQKRMGSLVSGIFSMFQGRQPSEVPQDQLPPFLGTARGDMAMDTAGFSFPRSSRAASVSSVLGPIVKPIPGDTPQTTPPPKLWAKPTSPVSCSAHSPASRGSAGFDSGSMTVVKRAPSRGPSKGKPMGTATRSSSKPPPKEARAGTPSAPEPA